LFSALQDKPMLDLDPNVRGVLVVCLFLALGKILHTILLSQLHRLAQRSKLKWDDVLVGKIRRSTLIVVLFIAASAGVQASGLELKSHPGFLIAIKAGIIFGVFWTFERALVALIEAQVLLSSLTAATRGLVGNIARLGLMVLGLLMILDAAGVSITPILASLGIGSLAVALALQDTLSNLFSGLYILADKPLRIGDFVEIDGGLQGHVLKIGWRTTHLRTLVNNVVVVPNSKLASATMTNYDMSEPEMTFSIPVGVSYDSDLDHVESVILSVSNQMQKTHPSAAPFFEPRVRFREFGDSSINCNVLLRARTFDDQFPLRHDFIKALHKRFQTENIEIPFPQRVMQIKSDLPALAKELSE
jgi:small-conductance mechanosensitive channel